VKGAIRGVAIMGDEGEGDISSLNTLGGIGGRGAFPFQETE